jgi:[acyl-carrier-protein] S-malonyltransferase
MAPAVEALDAYSQGVSKADPEVALWSNAGGVLVSSGESFIQSLVSQVKSPVRWDLCMEAMVKAGVTAILEVPPAGTLVGLAKRSMPGIETLALKSPDQLEAAQTLIANHTK